ncbi:hypothetical protein [Ralstonia pseudosolanacearum]|uniref:hypothetical protein n=1 Tax=Ralstonia pseudosolanacearum TaxID=1310165 RepID=UPI0026746E59|nr:hypothetical protein [Ralstonia pseudosolanacearum]MDO3517749.1 hypothetical protein [Ralstonia pseudosolanacearum]MDO3541034.1 hypothetical protein [Ralstonia pseudosolanacearum]
MSLLSQADIQQVIKQAKALNESAPEKPIEDFFGDVLSLNKIQRASAFPDPDKDGVAAINISHLTAARDSLLRDKGEVPPFVVFQKPPQNRTFIAGLCTYLQSRSLPHGYPSDFIDRVTSHRAIRTELLQIDKGHKLELVAAAILAASCHYGEATRGSGDQGLDAVAWNHLIQIDDAFLDGFIGQKIVRPGHRVMVVASSKAAIGADPDALKLINPAHIRELVGGWLIQRSESSAWKGIGMQMLTPLQLVLVTTYRLSEESKAECQKLGVQVWTLPELIYLICRYAPPAVFSSGKSNAFSKTDFNAWWAQKAPSRISPSAELA